MGRKELRPFDKLKLNDLIDEFEQAHERAPDLAKKMRNWNSGKTVASRERIQLADWCRESDDTRTTARQIARQISVLVFGKVIDEFD